MWNGCHWRLLYDFEEPIMPDLKQYLNETHPEDYDRIVEYFSTLNKDDAVYKFASTYGSLDWTGILIMIACGRRYERYLV